MFTRTPHGRSRNGGIILACCNAQVLYIHHAPRLRMGIPKHKFNEERPPNSDAGLFSPGLEPLIPPRVRGPLAAAWTFVIVSLLHRDRSLYGRWLRASGWALPFIPGRALGRRIASHVSFPHRPSVGMTPWRIANLRQSRAAALIIPGQKNAHDTMTSFPISAFSAALSREGGIAHDI